MNLPTYFIEIYFATICGSFHDSHIPLNIWHLKNCLRYPTSFSDGIWSRAKRSRSSKPPMLCQWSLASLQNYICLNEFWQNDHSRSFTSHPYIFVLHHMQILQLITAIRSLFSMGSALSRVSYFAIAHTYLWTTFDGGFQNWSRNITSRLMWAFSRFAFSLQHLAHQLSCLRYPILFSFQLFSSIPTVRRIWTMYSHLTPAERPTSLRTSISPSFVRHQRNLNRSGKKFFSLLLCNNRTFLDVIASHETVSPYVLFPL